MQGFAYRQILDTSYTTYQGALTQSQLKPLQDLYHNNLAKFGTSLSSPTRDTATVLTPSHYPCYTTPQSPSAHSHMDKQRQVLSSTPRGDTA